MVQLNNLPDTHSTYLMAHELSAGNITVLGTSMDESIWSLLNFTPALNISLQDYNLQLVLPQQFAGFYAHTTFDLNVQNIL